MTSRPPPPMRYDDSEEERDDPQISERSRGVAVVLAVIGGPLGLHRFYVGRVQSGILMALTIGGMGIWWLYDMVLLLAGEFRDADDLPVREWEVSKSVGRRATGNPDVRHLVEDVDALRQQVGELAERLDFAERMLAQQKERARLPRGE
jgi:TM2 domain-containing membrane protein YozV